MANGIFFGMAISSRFLLNFHTGLFSQILSFLLLFMMLSALIYWARKYRETLPDKKITQKILCRFLMIVFLIGAIFSSVVKYIYFEYIKSDEFQYLVTQAMNMMITEQSEYKGEIEQSMQYVIPANFAIITGVGNLILGFITYFIIWPIFKNEQEFSN